VLAIVYTLFRLPRPCSCSCTRSYSRRGGAVNGGRPGGEGERAGGPGEDGRRTEGGLIVIVVPPYDSPARAGKEKGESGTRKPCSSLSSIFSGVVARAFPLLIFLALSSSTSSIVISLRALAFLCVLFFFYIFFSTASGTPIKIYISSSRRSVAVISLNSPLMNYSSHFNWFLAFRRARASIAPYTALYMSFFLGERTRPYSIA
jgi:hypothetical protein